MALYTNSDAHTERHELAHVLGLADQYREAPVMPANGMGPPERRTVPKIGYELNLMGSWGFDHGLTEQQVDDIVHRRGIINKFEYDR